jgi:hypothetical protein
LRLWNNDAGRSPHREGLNLFCEAVAKRFGDEDFERVFGEGPEAGRRLAEHLVALSGGHFRDLQRLFRETIILIQTWRPVLPVAPEVLDRAIVNVRNEYLPIAIEDAKWLAKIAAERDTALPDSNPESIGRLSRFLDSHLVLYLANGDDWYDLHPLILDEVTALAKRSEKESS